jgi:hypothetical protein
MDIGPGATGLRDVLTGLARGGRAVYSAGLAAGSRWPRGKAAQRAAAALALGQRLVSYAAARRSPPRSGRGRAAYGARSTCAAVASSRLTYTCSTRCSPMSVSIRSTMPSGWTASRS